MPMEERPSSCPTGHKSGKVRLKDIVEIEKSGNDVAAGKILSSIDAKSTEQN